MRLPAALAVVLAAALLAVPGGRAARAQAAPASNAPDPAPVFEAPPPSSRFT